MDRVREETTPKFATAPAHGSRAGLPGARHQLLIGAAYVASYVALDWVSYIHPFAQLAITPWNPPPGLSLFLLLRFGLRQIPLLFIAALLAEFVVRGASDHVLFFAIASALLAGGYAALGAVLVRSLGVGRELATLRDINRFVAGALFGPALIALAYVGAHVGAGVLAAPDFVRAVLQFWIGDAIGIVVTTPLLLEFFRRPPRFAPRFNPGLVAQSVAVMLAIWVVFGLPATDEFKFFYVLFVPLIWVAMNRGLRGTLVVTVAIQLGIVAASGRLTAKGIELFELQFLMLALALTSLYLGTAITERRAAQRRLAAGEAALSRAMRMATAGELAAAITHELNQPLSAIATYVGACTELVDRPQDRALLRQTLESMGREVSRAGAVIRRLRDFFRTGAPRREPVFPGALVQGAIEPLALRIAQQQASVEVSCDPQLPAVEVDRIQMQAVLHNLLANAIDAMDAARTPVRRIAVAVTHGPGDRLTCIVDDSGPGIEREAASRLFEAFNSTKPDGMGLGLAMSRSIVEAHGGELVRTDSRLGGAAFSMTLPLQHRADESRRS